jgi:hypothetical protein
VLNRARGEYNAELVDSVGGETNTIFYFYRLFYEELPYSITELSGKNT